MAYELIQNISTYGLLPGKAPGSNLAVAGFLDMPKRMNKVYHEWPDEPGVQPWLSASLMQWEGRDIDFYCILKGSNLADAKSKLDLLYTDWAAEDDLVPLVTTAGTEHNVYQRADIAVEHLQGGWMSVMIPLREPVVDLSGNIPTEADSENFVGLDRISWNTLKMFPEDLYNRYSRAGMHEPNAIGYSQEAFEINKRTANMRELKATLVRSSLADLVAGVQGLYAILLQAKLIRLKMHANADSRNMLVHDGFSISNIMASSNRATATLRMNLIEDGIVQDVLDNIFLLLESGDALLLESGDQLIL